MRLVVKPTVAALIVALCSTLVIACDGDAAPGLWEHNRVVVRLLLAVAFVLLTTTTVLYFVPHRKGLLVLLASIVLVIFHPAWVYGGGGGDCGVSMAEGARNSAILLTLGVAYQLTFLLVKRRAP